MIHLYSAQGDLIKKFVMPDMETINSMTFSPDSRRLVTGHGHYLLGSGDNVIRVWNLEGTVLQEFKGHIDAVLAVAVSPDGTILASGSGSGDLILWNMDGTVIRRLNATETDKDAINSIAFSPDSSLVSTAAGAFPYRKNGDDTVKLWSKEGHLLKVMRGHSDSVMFTGFYNNGRMVATTSKDGSIRLWDLRGNPVHTFEAAWDFIYCSTFHPGGKLFATGDNLNRIHVRKTNGSIIATYSHSRYISDLQYSPDGSLLAAATGESNIVVRDKSGTVVTVIDSDRTIQQFCFTEDGGKIVSLDYNNIIRVWSTDGRLLNSFPKFEAMVDTFFLVPGKEQLAVGYKQDIVFYSLDGKEVRRFNYYQDFVESQMFSIYRVSNIAISPDNRYIAATANDMMGNGKYIIKVFSPEGGLVRTLEGHSATLTAFAFSPDSRLLVSGSVDGEVRIWDVASGDFTKLTGHTDEIRDLDFNNNGTLLLSVSKDTSSRLWNVQNGRNISIVNQEDEWIAYSPDGLFDSSREGGNIVSIVDGLFVYGLDQFAVTMNRPDIILGETGLADRQETDYYHALHEKRLRKLGLDTNGNSMKYEVPIALIKSIQQNGKFLKVRFLVSGKTMPVNRYNIYINDVPIYGAYGKPVKDKKRATIVETIELSRGSNKNRDQLYCHQWSRINKSPG
jgi:WD40 repeat protein